MLRRSNIHSFAVAQQISTPVDPPGTITALPYADSELGGSQHSNSPTVHHHTVDSSEPFATFHSMGSGDELKNSGDERVSRSA